MKKRILSILLATCLLVGLLPLSASAASDPGNYVFDIAEGTIRILDGNTEGTIKVAYGDGLTTAEFDPSQEITVTGSFVTTSIYDSGKSLRVETDRPVKIRIKNLTIDNNKVNTTNVYAKDFEAMVLCGSTTGKAHVTLTLEGTNFLRGGEECGGIEVGTGHTLTIQGNGTLTAQGYQSPEGFNGSSGAGIGGHVANNCGTVIITGSTVTAIGGYGAAGIGGGFGEGSIGGNGGNIYISGGTVTATGGKGAAGIGGGSNQLGYTGAGLGGNVTITGGTVIATAGSDEADAIGGGRDLSGTPPQTGTLTVDGNAWVYASTTSTATTLTQGVVNNSVYGNVTLTEDRTIDPLLNIPEGTSLTVPAGKTLTTENSENYINVYGTLTNQGTLTTNGDIYVNGTLTNRGALTANDDIYVNGTLTNQGTLTANDDIYVSTTLTNQGTITGSGSITPEEKKLTYAAPPSAPEIASVSSDSITLKSIRGAEYSKDGTNWQSSPTFSGLTTGTAYTFYARYVGNGFYKTSASSEASAAQKTAANAPASGGGFSIDYVKQTLTVNDGYEVSPWEDFHHCYQTGSPITPGNYLYVRKAASGSTPASTAMANKIPDRPPAPDSSAYNIDYSSETISFDDSIYNVYNCIRIGNSIIHNAPVSNGGNVTPGKTLAICKKAVAGESFESYALTVDLPDRPAALTLSINNDTESVTIPSGYCYNTTGADYSGTWTVADGSAVTVDPDSSIYIYKASTDSDFKSSVQTLTAPSRGSTPAVTINYEAETLSTTTAMEYSKDSGATWTACSANMAATDFGWDGSAAVTVQFRTRATEGNYASDVQTVTIPARPATPTPTGVNETVDGKHDGQITGLTAGTVYQISSDNGATWQDKAADTDGWITGLVPAAYKARVKVTGTSFVSLAADVTIATGDERTYTLNVTAPTFSDVACGYVQPTAQAITITSSGNWDSTIASVTVDSADFTIGGSGDTVAAGGSIDTWTVQPTAGLTIGSYTATITVAYGGGDTAAATVSFTVTKAAQTAPHAPTVKSKTYNSVALEAIPDANGAAAQYSKDGGTTWQNGPEFTGLSANTEYSFVARYGETDNCFASPASAELKVTTNAAPSSGGSITYSPTVEQPDEGGTVTVSPKNPEKGDKVTITPKPEEIYEVGQVIVTDKNGNPVEVTDNGDGTYTFKQPSGKVTVTVTFKEKAQLNLRSFLVYWLSFINICPRNTCWSKFVTPWDA